ncbi:hypothetical protein [Paenibacillus sp. Marseille-Q4541]|uniref:hypothetical protein n=1 Tax=Paenibacillus sp. Marseille-Q4541 TaxID=2831522 RepID=UPI001BAA0C1C|nr:hypothetical protein [Paenibacillus sp. Marseille-Q4541]
MAKLRDKEKIGNYIEFSFLKCIPGDYEGCQLNFKYYTDDKKIYELDFAWTNLTIKNYIEVTSNFPVEMLNNFILNNLYTSFENHLNKLEWTELKEEKAYRLRFSGSQQDFSLNVVDDVVRQFGHDLEAEWEEGLSLA